MSLVSKDQRCLVRKYLADAIHRSLSALLHRPFRTSICVNPGGWRCHDPQILDWVVVGVAEVVGPVLINKKPTTYMQFEGTNVLPYYTIRRS